ncbi:nitroreductase family protein [Neogemmobacter tilapiae]|uniref:Putative NAD(P)H nitroreductase n=1 Tax=Neogemmobacter tilapiae TaxID=875041 RepID=A0A918TWJ6_9RHOB|nr:nitroreductase [Gemmobacter tilapiae]GHC65037.1 nitroreductase [Gemmobacter tilapiae]
MSNSTAFAFLAARQSYPAKAMTGPAPSRSELEPILQAALRVPDHGKLEPWRLIVLERAALDRLAAFAEQRAAETGLDAEQAAKGRGQFARSQLCIAVVSAPVSGTKVPESEQILSAGALCQNLLNAAQAAGWAACWLSGWPSYDRGFLELGLGLAPHESIAGFVHLGTQGTPAPDRPRPDLARVVQWVSA